MKKILALVLALCITLALAACGDSGNGDKSSSNSTPSTSQPAGDQSSGSSTGKTVGIAMPTKSLERWNRDGAYLEEQFKAAGYNTVVTFSDDKSEQQVNDIQNMLAQGVDLLVISAIDGNSLNTVMNDAGALGIPVIAYDRLIMNDNAAGPFNMEFTAGDPADNNTGYFFNGARSTSSPMPTWACWRACAVCCVPPV